MNRDGWYDGVIARFNSKDSTYHVVFDDGDELVDALEEEIRVVPSTATRNSGGSPTKNQVQSQGLWLFRSYYL